MAAGLGFKTFTTGEVLTAADVNGYLMQGVLVFASEAARDAAITSPQEGQFAFTKDNNSLWYYSGAAWVASGATGDIEGVTAGTGISGGGTSGTVTITNSMATEIDAKGDLVVGTGADTFARLAVGANGTVLTADSVETTGLKWVAPASGGGFTLIQDQQASASSAINFTSISGTYKHLLLTWEGLKATTDSSTAFSVRFNSDSGSNYVNRGVSFIGTTATATNSAGTSIGFGTFIGQGFTGAGSADKSRGYLWVYDYASTTRFKLCVGSTSYADQGLGEYNLPMVLTNYISASAITDLNIVRLAGTGNITNDANTSIRLYGVS
jgi:hypothetical protein